MANDVGDQQLYDRGVNFSHEERLARQIGGQYRNEFSRRGRRSTERSCWSSWSAITVLVPAFSISYLDFPTQAFKTLSGDDRHHDERCHGVSPPPAKKRIERKSSKEDGRKIGAKIGLAGVRLHGAAFQV